MPILRRVTTAVAPEPFGHYSQATIMPDDAIRVSAQLPAGSGISADSAVSDQARQALSDVLSIVEAAGGHLDSIARVTLHLTDITNRESVDVVYAQMFGAHRPARAVLQVTGPHHGFGVAADAVAWLVPGRPAHEQPPRDATEQDGDPR